MGNRGIYGSASNNSSRLKCSAVVMMMMQLTRLLLICYNILQYFVAKIVTEVLSMLMQQVLTGNLCHGVNTKCTAIKILLSVHICLTNEICIVSAEGFVLATCSKPNYLFLSHLL